MAQKTYENIIILFIVFNRCFTDDRLNLTNETFIHRSTE